MTLCRFVLAATFIFSGFVKGVDPLGTQYKIEDYVQALDCLAWVPDFIPLLLSVLLASFEFTLGVFLLFGIRRHVAPSAALLLMCVLTPFTAYVAVANPVSDCGCFGDAVHLSNWATFWKNVLLLAASVSVFVGRRLTFRLVSEKSAWLVSVYTIPFILGVIGYCLYYLPIFDFRPYHVGANIPEGMQIPEGKQPSVYETIFLMEKDGVRKEFTLDQYPDSTWTFVDARSVLKEKGYEPPIHDFSIVRADDGEDLTDEILADEGYTFLLVAHRVEEADDSNIDLVNEAFDYSQENGYGFYCLTASGEDEIALWQDRTGAEYPFCLTDDITLKTIVRSNPGLLLVKNGTIYRKWSSHDLPDEYMLNGRLEEIEAGRPDTDTWWNTWVVLLLWYVVPMLVIAGLDLLLVRRRRPMADEKKKTEPFQ